MASFLCVLPFLFFFLSPVSRAEREGLLNQLLAPGPLMEGHKHLEGSRCLDCHGAGKGIVDDKCLKCHVEIKKFRVSKTGFHGGQTKDCMSCHSDHKGRGNDTTLIDKEKFDHKATGFHLTGKHAEIKCQDCHTEKRTKMKVRKNDLHFLGASKSCNDCHKKEDPHFFVGQFAKKSCGDCHSVETWKKDTRFNHDIDTKFKLEEAHAKMKCNECHQLKNKTMKYAWPNLQQQKCLSCHEDFHKTRLSNKWTGPKCLECHNQTKWKIEQFDHGKTNFKLEGKHAEAKCLDCHKQQGAYAIDGKNHANWRGLKQNCNSCHEDVHMYGSYVSKKFGALQRCQTCHGSKDWKTSSTFVHNRDTNFHIDGEHNQLKCEACHIPSKFKFTSQSMLKEVVTSTKSIYHYDRLASTTCNACHINPHLGVFSDKSAKMACTECHVTLGWTVNKSQRNFDHSKTRLPLSGGHAKLECKDCHVRDNKQIYKFALDKQGGCVDCHENIHINQMNRKFSSKACTDCHTDQSWKALDDANFKFDHQQTRFQLTGKHQETNCKECHKFAEPKRRQFMFNEAEKKFCVACHDNVHKNQFSREFQSKACSECHNTKDFTQRLEFDHSETDYPLRGKHKSLKCSECHVPQKELGAFESGHKKGKFKFPHLGRRDCKACHQDEHKGQFGNSCSQCHNESDWSATRDFHRNFRLSGTHLLLSCNECHGQNRHLAGTSQNCLFCHKKDDPHLGTLPNCGQCHNQNFWDARAFQHSRTRFPLRGVHRTLDCIECHNRGIYRGTPITCSACHLQDAMNASVDHKTFTNLNDCTSCHKNHFSFSNPK